MAATLSLDGDSPDGRPAWPYCSHVDDLQRPPTDGDRERVVARVNQAHDQGRISTADRDIRLGNVRSAQSMAELDLMSRDLDQLEAALPYSKFDPAAGVGPEAVSVSAPPRRIVLAVALVVVLVVIAVAALVVVGFRVSRSSDEASTASPAAPVDPASEQPATAPDTDPGVDPPAAPAYSLSAGGVRSFLATYRKKFGTSRVVDITFYGDYVIVNVPVPGKARQEGWLYRKGTWTGFGGIRATFPGTQVVDTNRLDIPALARNIARAKRTLNVEQPQAYVIIRFLPQIDQTPSVDVHVSNTFQESGYLATTLDGQVQRAYPYTR
jgi:hypothetical protein